MTQGKLLFTRLLDETENNGFKCHRVEMKTMTNIPKDINKEMKTICKLFFQLSHKWEKVISLLNLLSSWVTQ